MLKKEEKKETMISEKEKKKGCSFEKRKQTKSLLVFDTTKHIEQRTSQ